MCKRFEDFNEEAKKYRAILLNYQEKGEVFVDPNFHPTAKIPEKEDLFNDSTIEWIRIDEVYKAPLFKKELIHYDFVKQGTLADCYLLSVISHLSQQPSLIPLLFDNKANIYLGKEEDTINIKCGAVVIYFHAFGRRTPILIDTLIPFSKETHTPIFSHPSDTTKSPWFCLVEKAYAKLNESYTEVAGGTFSQAIYSIFGYSSTVKNFSKLKSPEKSNKMTPFERILKYQKQGAIIGAGIHVEKLEGITEEELTSKGLITVHSYLLLKTKQYDGKNFLCLRNPWGEHEWNGDWSDNSELWTPELKNEVGMKSCDDGTFWMIDSDFFKYFTEIEVGLPIPSTWHSRHFFYKLTPGGYDDLELGTEEAFNSNLARFAFQVTENFNEAKKCHLQIVCERRHSLLDGNGKYNEAPPPFCVELKSRYLLTVRLFQMAGPSHIISYPYFVNNNDEMLVIQLRRLGQTPLEEDCYVKVFCEKDFKLIDVSHPEVVVPEDSLEDRIFDRLEALERAKASKAALRQNQAKKAAPKQQQLPTPSHPKQQQQQPNKPIQSPPKQQQQSNKPIQSPPKQQQQSNKPIQSPPKQQQQPNKPTGNLPKQQQKLNQPKQNHPTHPMKLSQSLSNQQPNRPSQSHSDHRDSNPPQSPESHKQSRQWLDSPSHPDRRRARPERPSMKKLAQSPSYRPKISSALAEGPIRPGPRNNMTPVKHLIADKELTERQSFQPSSPMNVRKTPKQKPAKGVDLDDKSIRKMYKSISKNVYKTHL